MKELLSKIALLIAIFLWQYETYHQNLIIDRLTIEKDSLKTLIDLPMKDSAQLKCYKYDTIYSLKQNHVACAINYQHK